MRRRVSVLTVWAARVGGTAAVILALGATAVAPRAGAAGPARRAEAVLLPRPFPDIGCDLVDDGTDQGSWVYCWSFPSGSAGPHVKLGLDGQFSLVTTAPLPQGIGGPGDPVGARLTAGRFRCDVLSAGIRCTVPSLGKGFLMNDTGITAVSLPAETTLPAPVFGRTADLRPVSGTVSIRQPGSAGFVPLSAATSIPMGTIVDATGGTVELTSAVSTAGGRQSGRFRGGAFRLTQATARSQVRRGRRVGFTVLSLADGAAPVPACPAATAGAVAAAKHGPPRRLWGDAHGNYRTVGRYAAATVGGTRWRTEDTCSGTLVTVARGVVAVENLRTHRTQVVRAGGSLLTKAPAPAGANASPAFFVDFLHAVDRTTRLVRRPASIVLFADGKWGLIHLSWTGWGAAVAHATGTSVSYGAPGDPPVEAPGEVTLSNPGPFQGRVVYRCILVTVPPPADFGGRRCIRHVGRFYVFG